MTTSLRHRKSARPAFPRPRRVATTLLFLAIGLTGCTAADEAHAPLAGPTCDKLSRSSIDWRGAPPTLGRSTRLEQVFETPDIGTVTVYPPGGAGAMMLARLLGTTITPSGRNNIRLHYGYAKPCAANAMSARNGHITGCRTDGCTLSATYRGRSIKSFDLYLPARLEGGEGREVSSAPPEAVQAVSKAQAACLVAGITSATGLWGMWTAFPSEDIRVEGLGSNAYSYGVVGSSDIWKCKRAEREDS